MRLAFSVAINVDADVLLIDEILAVGDSAFQKKCFEKLQQLKRRGTTIVIVSHSLEQILEICDRAIWIEEGIIREDGRPYTVCADYIEYMDNIGRERARQESEQVIFEQTVAYMEESEQIKKNLTCKTICPQCSPLAIRRGNGKNKFVSICLENARTEEKNGICVVDSDGFSLKLAIEHPLEEGTHIVTEIFAEGNILCHGFSVRSPEKTEFQLQYKNIQLQPRKYWLSMSIQGDDGVRTDELQHILEFTVEHPVDLKHKEQYGIVVIDCLNI